MERAQYQMTIVLLIVLLLLLLLYINGLSRDTRLLGKCFNLPESKFINEPRFLILQNNCSTF